MGLLKSEDVEVCFTKGEEGKRASLVIMNTCACRY